MSWAKGIAIQISYDLLHSAAVMWLNWRVGVGGESPTNVSHGCSTTAICLKTDSLEHAMLRGKMVSVNVGSPTPF